MLTALFVVARIVANPVSNVFQKQLTQRSANPLFIIGATDALLALAVLPLFFLGAVPLALAPGFWTNMVICASLAVASNVLLVYALQSADLSVLVLEVTPLSSANFSTVRKSSSAFRSSACSMRPPRS